MTTFVHIGDFHASAGPRNADRYQALDQILDECQDLEHLGAFLWPGDVFDGLSSIDDRNAIDARLRRMACQAPVLIVEGNHDKPGDLRGFANLSGAWPIIVVDRQPALVRVELPTLQTATIWAVPYPHKGPLVGAGVAHGDLVKTANDLFEPIFMKAAADLDDARRRGHLTLMVFHANIAGAVTSAAGQPNIGRELELTQSHLDRLGRIYKGGNHIHKPQEIAGAWFAGSVARKDYGEIEEKRYLLVGVDGDSSYAVTSKPIAIPPMYHVTGRLDRHGFSAYSEDPDVQRRVAENDWAGCDVRVRYDYPGTERAVLDEAALRARFASALRLKVEGVVIPDRELRAPAVATAKTLTEKLAAMREDRALPASIANKVDALEQRDRDAILADVRAWLTSVESGEKARVAA